jgi:hypothetical protein
VGAESVQTVLKKMDPAVRFLNVLIASSAVKTKSVWIVGHLCAWVAMNVNIVNVRRVSEVNTVVV